MERYIINSIFETTKLNIRAVCGRQGQIPESNCELCFPGIFRECAERLSDRMVNEILGSNVKL